MARTLTVHPVADWKLEEFEAFCGRLQAALGDEYRVVVGERQETRAVLLEESAAARDWFDVVDIAADFVEVGVGLGAIVVGVRQAWGKLRRRPKGKGQPVGTLLGPRGDPIRRVLLDLPENEHR